MTYRFKSRFSAVLMTVTFLLLNTAQGVRAGTVHILSPSARSYGMGISGVADASDPSNAYYNPSNISFINGIYLSGFYSQLVPDLASDVYTGSLGISGGTRIKLGESVELGLGGSLRYQKLDYGEWTVAGITPEELGTASSSEYTLSYSLACGLIINEVFSAGIGLSVKPTKLNLAPAWGTLEGVANESDEVALDFGILMQAAFPIAEGYTLTGSIGTSFLNNGNDFTFTSSYQTIPMPSAVRYGAGVRLESPRMDDYDDWFGPIITLAGNFDILDHTEEGSEERSDESNYGIEVAILQLIFLRTGYWEYESGNISGSTFGLGFGLEYRNFTGRIDYARVPQAAELAKTNKLGIIIGMKF